MRTARGPGVLDDGRRARPLVYSRERPSNLLNPPRLYGHACEREGRGCREGCRPAAASVRVRTVARPRTSRGYGYTGMPGESPRAGRRSSSQRSSATPSKMKRSPAEPDRTRRDFTRGVRKRPRRIGHSRVTRSVTGVRAIERRARGLPWRRARTPWRCPRRRRDRERALDGVDDGVVDSVTLQEVGRLVAGHLGGTGVEGGAHHVLHGSVQGVCEVQGAGANGETSCAMV